MCVQWPWGGGGRPTLRGQGRPPEVFPRAGLQSDQAEPLLEAAIGCWGQQSKGKMSKRATNNGLCIHMEAYSVKDLLMQSLKKEAHNTVR